MPTYEKGHVRAPNKDHLIQLSARHHGNRLQALLSLALPTVFDCIAQGWVGPIKNQKSCGSCWDFSGTGVVEGAYNKAGVGGGPNTMILSEEYTLSCARNGGCGGDDNVTVLDWAKKTGLPLTKDYGPYTAHAQRCAFAKSMTLYKIDDWGFCDGNGGNGVAPADSIKAAMMEHGPIGSAIAADGAFDNCSPNQVFSGRDHGINHDIILVGWDDSKGKTAVSGAMDPSLVSLPSVTATLTAWRLRNSWDTSWCDGGYCWILEGANDVGTEAVWAMVKSTNPPIDDWTP